MCRVLSIAVLTMTLMVLGAAGASAQGQRDGVLKPHYGGGRNGMYGARGPAVNYARPAMTAPQPAVASEPGYRSFSFEPSGINANDMVVVNHDHARLMLGRNLVAELPKGTEFKVTRIQSGWLGAVVSVNGQEHKGWIRSADVSVVSDAPPAPPTGA